MLFHPDRVGNGNDDISSEKHFENSTRREKRFLFTVLLNLFIFVQIFELHHVIQPLWKGREIGRLSLEDIDKARETTFASYPFSTSG